MTQNNMKEFFSVQKWFFVVCVLLVAMPLGYKVLLDFSNSKSKVTLSPGVQQNPLPQSLPAQAASNISSASPERVLNEYAQSVTDKNFSEIARIYPTRNEELLRSWLQGGDGKAPIATVQVVGQPKIIKTSADGAEIVLSATMQYCRQDRSGSRDTKNYTFIQTQGNWKLHSMTAAVDVRRIRC